MPFIICQNCKHKYLSTYHDSHGLSKLCYSCVQISKCTCKFWSVISENCNKHFCTEKDRREKADWYTGKGWHLIKYSVSKKCGDVNGKFSIIGEEVCMLKKAAIKCLMDNNIRVENLEEEYFYKRIIDNFHTLY